jgi:branched-chain amino acid transport system ATP-binding protein
LLQVNKVSKRFGGLIAVNEVDFQIEANEIVGLIGPNGAGKTTLFNCLSGIYPISSGQIVYKGRDITQTSKSERCKSGFGRTFQIPRPFLDLTVLDNVAIGLLFGSEQSRSLNRAREEALKYLEFTSLTNKKDKLATNLTIQNRKSLEIARALATEPEVVMLDEIMSGLNPTETIEMMALIRRIRDDLKVTVLWIEHVMKALMAVAERVIVLHQGRKIADNTPSIIAEDPNVIDAYLGERYVF